jgi:outer membrane biosynthesis protein TonB
MAGMTHSIQTGWGNERQYLVVGVILSVVTHLAALGLWLLFGVLIANANRAVFEDLIDQAERQARAEPPMVFVEVMPDQASAEAPDEAEFYSSVSSRAANPDPTLDTPAPKIDGDQEMIMRTADVPRPQVENLQPAPEPAEEVEEEIVEVQPKPRIPEPAGDLAMLRPPSMEPEPAPRSRLTRLAQVRPESPLLAGDRMRQDGGVRRAGRVSVDVKGTPFGAYDAAIIRAIQQRWYDILDESTILTRSGKVVVEFRIHHDGRVTDLRVVDQDVGELLSLFCRRAISDPAPFAAWPSDMRRMVGKDYRDVRFTFYYM